MAKLNMNPLVLNDWQTIIYKLFIVLLVLIVVTQCYSISKTNHQKRSVAKDETRYPNGTVVGKYSYKDKEGNPIQVKYYADDSSYGVELQSIKIMTPTDQLHESETTDQKYLIQNTVPPMDLASQFNNPSNVINNISDQLEILNRDLKTNNFKTYKVHPDYELYFQNKVKAPKKCGKDKVRVYFEKDDRKTRNADNNLDQSKYCEQF